MAARPPRLCPRCARRITGAACTYCRTRTEQRRGTAHQRGYTVQWSAVSRAWLQAFPWCGQRADGQLHADHSLCVQQARRTRADVTDHIRSMKQGGHPFDPKNLQSLCRSCNSRKAVALEGGWSKD